MSAVKRRRLRQLSFQCAAQPTSRLQSKRNNGREQKTVLRHRTISCDATKGSRSAKKQMERALCVCAVCAGAARRKNEKYIQISKKRKRTRNGLNGEYRFLNIFLSLFCFFFVFVFVFSSLQIDDIYLIRKYLVFRLFAGRPSTSCLRFA